ncbi:aspartate racemase/maleate isomerase family protein [Streptomyces sp. NPDC001500]
MTAAGARLGILVIHNDPVPETEIWRMAPEGVSVHTARFECPRPADTEYVGSPAAALANAPDVVRGLDQLGRLGADSIALCFGSSSFFGGPAFDAEFVEAAGAHAHGVPVYTAATAITAALRATAVRRPLLVMPPWFTEPTFRATEEYLGEVGVEGTRLVQFELGPEWDGVARYNAFDEGAHWTIDPAEVHQQVVKAFHDPDRPRPDGVLVPGSGFPSRAAVVPLEQELGVPVLTSNQAVLWHGLRHAAPGTAPEAAATARGSLFIHRLP